MEDSWDAQSLDESSLTNDNSASDPSLLSHDQLMELALQRAQSRGLGRAPSGLAPGPAARPEARSASSATPGQPSSVTPATATDRGSAATHPPDSSMPAASTWTPSEASTVWSVSPLGYVEQTDRPSLPVSQLPVRVQSSLQQLAMGSDQPVDAIVLQIAEYFIENESELAEGRLDDAVIWYMDNEQL